jgi:macrolide transport system ATP-binding/permease protein
MRIAHVVKQRLRSLFSRSKVDWELSDEVELHLELLTRERMAEGMNRRDAITAARREFGSVSLAKEHCRDTRRTALIDNLTKDTVFALRGLAKAPVFTATALLSLALGIGANTAICSFLEAILMRTLPVADPATLVAVNWSAGSEPKVIQQQHGDHNGHHDQGGNYVSDAFPYPAFESLGAHRGVLSSLFAFADAERLNLVAAKQAILVSGKYVSGNYFNALGTSPAAGRLIDDFDDRTGANPVAVISYRIWQQSFGGNTNAVGQTILINRKPFTVAGVTAPNFSGVNPRDTPEVYLPLHALAYVDPRVRDDSWFHDTRNYWIEMMGRLSPNVTLRQAEIALATRFHAFVAGTATTAKERDTLPKLFLQEGGSGLDALRRQYSSPLAILFAMTSVILVIACANLANLLLARATARRREFAVRLSLGASRWRIVQQLLTESLLLAISGGLLGLMVAALGIQFLTSLLGSGQENFTLHAEIDGRILLLAFSLSILAGLAFGLAPALQATTTDVAPALKETRAAALRARRFGLPFGISQSLVAGQIALSTLLLVAAGFFVGTLIKLHSIPTGFNSEKLLTFRLDAKLAGYDDRRSATFYESLRERFAKLPGVTAASMNDMPLGAGAANSDGIQIPGMAASPDHKLSTNDVLVGPSFFSTMQIPIVLGRQIGEGDTHDAPHVAVVNEAFAKKFFPQQNPLGQRFNFQGGTDVQIIGVVKNSVYSSLKTETPPVAYVPWSQIPPGWMPPGMSYELRTLRDPLALANSVRQEVHRISPLVPVTDLSTQARSIEATIAPERTFAHLSSGFGLLALVIACVGLYGTMAYSVVRRTNEIGVRIALGAQRGNVLWMMQSEALRLCCFGIAAGLIAAWQMKQLVASFLFGIRSDDAVAFVAPALLLILCATAASFAPAWRASRTDQMQALRNE